MSEIGSSRSSPGGNTHYTSLDFEATCNALQDQTPVPDDVPPMNNRALCLLLEAQNREEMETLDEERKTRIREISYWTVLGACQLRQALEKVNSGATKLEELLNMASHMESLLMALGISRREVQEGIEEPGFWETELAFHKSLNDERQQWEHQPAPSPHTLLLLKPPEVAMDAMVREVAKGKSSTRKKAAKTRTPPARLPKSTISAGPSCGRAATNRVGKTGRREETRYSLRELPPN